ncbi:MAG: insulinase family protein [Candidatus Eremiobacteraeota bacterium]|nr:insulinase family protein [Candidatus Eremiobacteraeota bacterium]
MKRSFVPLLGTLILTLLAAAPLPSPAITGPGDGGIYSTTLRNGLKVVAIEDRAAPVVQTAVWYGFGSLDETPGKTGLAHALEHMMFRGTPEVSSGGLDDIVARLGAQMNGETTYDYTQYYFVMPADKLDVALYVDANRMQHASLKASEWAVERNAVLNELDGDSSSPFFDLLSRVRAAAFAGQPAGRTPLGSRADVANASVADIRRYYDEWYAPNNATLVVAGDVDHTAVFSKAQRYFGAIPAKKLPHKPNLDPVAKPGQTVEAHFPFPFEVVDLAYAVPGDTQKGEPAISTLSTLINNERSPFYEALVQSNIAVALDSNADTQLRGGLLNVFIVLNPGHTADEAQRAFQGTIDRVLQQGYDPDLVDAAKALTTGDRLFSADSIDGIGDLAGYTYGIVGEKLSDEDQRLAALTGKDLLDATRTYLSAPTVVGHLRPSETPPKGNSNKATAAANDDFSKRIPNGPIVEPAWVSQAVRTPTTARSPLAPTTFTLSNGLKVIVQRKTDRPTFVLQGRIASSAAFEPFGQSGIIRLADAVADYGSEKYPFAARHKITDTMGAYVQTGQNFSAQGTIGDFEKIADILADGEAHPTFAEPWFGIERSQLANGLQSEQNISGVLIDRAYDQLLLSNDDPTLHQPSVSSVTNLSRDDLLSFARKYWRPDLTTIAVVGDLDPQRVRTALEAAFGGWVTLGPRPDPRLMAMPPASGGHDYISTAASQVFIRLGQPAVARSSPDYDAFLVLNQILGGSGAFESRLWQELRQKRGLVYGVNSSLISNADRGDFRVELNASPDRVVEAVRFVREELERLQNEPVSATELAEAKVRLASNALLDEASSHGQAKQLLDIETYDLPGNYYATLNEHLAGITAADVQRVARTYLKPKELVEVYAGPSGPWATGAL